MYARLPFPTSRVYPTTRVLLGLMVPPNSHGLGRDPSRILPISLESVATLAADEARACYVVSTESDVRTGLGSRIISVIGAAISIVLKALVERVDLTDSSVRLVLKVPI